MSIAVKEDTNEAKAVPSRKVVSPSLPYLCDSSADLPFPPFPSLLSPPSPPLPSPPFSFSSLPSPSFSLLQMQSESTINRRMSQKRSDSVNEPDRQLKKLFRAIQDNDINYVSISGAAVHLSIIICKPFLPSSLSFPLSSATLLPLLLPLFRCGTSLGGRKQRLRRTRQVGRVGRAFATHFANARSVPNSDGYVRVMVHGSILCVILVILVKLSARKLIPKMTNSWITGTLSPACQPIQGSLTKIPEALCHC